METDIRDILVQNAGSYDITVTIGQTEPSEHSMDASVVLIPGGKSILKQPGSTPTGSAKMYVQVSNKVIWCGIVPLSRADSRIPIIIDPDTKKVTYLDMSIPGCPKTGSSREYFGERPDPPDGIDFFKVIMMLVIVFAVAGIWELVFGDKE